jgi:hypothetical protein
MYYSASLVADADPSPPSRAVGHERVKLYLYSLLLAVQPVQSLSACTRGALYLYLAARCSRHLGGNLVELWPHDLAFISVRCNDPLKSWMLTLLVRITCNSSWLGDRKKSRMGFLLKDGRGGALMDKWLAEWAHNKICWDTPWILYLVYIPLPLAFEAWRV